MFGFLFKLIIIEATILTSNTDNEKDLTIKRFITAFDDKTLLKNWIESKNIKCLTSIELLEYLTKKIKDIISVINNEEYSIIKSLVMKTNIVLENLCYPFFETFNIINSVQRIITINDKINKTKSTTQNNFEEIIYREYDLIYSMLEITIIKFGFEHNATKTSEQYIELVENKWVKTTKIKETMRIDSSNELMLYITQYANCVFDSALPDKIDNSFFYKASYEGFDSSVKCRDKAKYLFIREKTSIAYSKCIFSYKTKTDDKFNLNNCDIKNYMNKSFLCDNKLLKELITLFHYYSEVTKKNTTYEITLKQDKKYQIKWSFLKEPTVKEIKKYWMEQEVTDFSKFKTSSSFGPIRISNVEYSIHKSLGTEKQPIKTRLLALSCGDLLGFELIEQFLEKYYMKYTRPLDCPYCNLPTSILGSYNAIVYRLKQDKPCILS